MTTSSASPKKAVRKAAPRKRSATGKRPAAKKVPAVKPVSVLIVGAGFAGLGMAIRLKQAGIDNFVILERANAVGGTWRDNQYPGAACDIPSNLYSYSFAPNPNWSRSFSGLSLIHI